MRRAAILRIKKGNPRIDLFGPGIFFSGPGKQSKNVRREDERMKAWKIVFLFGMVCLGPMINGAYGAGNEERVTLEPVVVTGTRAEQKIERVPANVTVIDEEDIKNSNAKTVVDLLRSEEGIVVRDLLGNGKRSQVDLRGFGESGPYNTLVLVDGRRVNEIDLSGVDWTQIPLEQIERIEVVRGTGTVLYGDNAVGGVINIITKIPPRKLAFSAGAIAGSYGRNKEQMFMSGGYRDNGEFRAKDVGGKIVFDATEFLSLNLSGSYHSDDYGLPGPLTEQEMAIDRRATTSPLDEAESTDQYLKLGFDLDLGWQGSIVTDFSYRDRKSEAQFPDPLFPSATQGETQTWGITPRYVWGGEIFNHANMLTAGIDFYRSEKDLKAYSGSFTPVAVLSGLADIERESHGVYFTNEFSLLENLILSVGARHERVKYNLNQQDLAFGLAPLDATVTERENAYSAGLTFLYSGKSSVFARTNRSLRFPLTDEVVIFDYVAGRLRVNSDLKPQTGKHYEVGLRHYVTPDIQGSVTFFYAQIDDEIFYNPSTFTNENHPETLHHGAELGAKAGLFEKLTLFANYTYEKAKFEKDPYKDNDIPAVPRHKANVGFRIHDFVRGLIFSADYSYVGSSHAISDQANDFEKLKEHYAINTRLSYEWKMLKAFAGVNNITDQKYSDYSVMDTFLTRRNFYPAPERNWVAGLEIAF
jgi:iron complex outermembrane receptor protein